MQMNESFFSPHFALAQLPKWSRDCNKETEYEDKNALNEEKHIEFTIY